jgi:hypothetical protein
LVPHVHIGPFFCHQQSLCNKDEKAEGSLTQHGFFPSNCILLTTALTQEQMKRKLEELPLHGKQTTNTHQFRSKQIEGRMSKHSCSILGQESLVLVGDVHILPGILLKPWKTQQMTTLSSFRQSHRLHFSIRYQILWQKHAYGAWVYLTVQCSSPEYSRKVS